MADYTVVNGSSTVLGASDVAYINGFASKFKVAYSKEDGVITLTNKSTKAVYEFSAAAGAKLAFLNGAVTVGADGKVSLKKAAINPAINSVESFTTVAPAAFTLTTGVDDWTGKSTNETIKAVYDTTAADSTLTAFDSINGGGGTDTLIISSTDAIAAGDIALLGVTLTSVENVTIQNTAATTVNAADLGADVKSLHLKGTTAAQAVTLNAGITDVTVTSTAAATITGNAGKDVLKTLTLNKTAAASTSASDVLTTLNLNDVSSTLTNTAAAGTRELTVNAKSVSGAAAALDATATSLNVNLSGGTTAAPNVLALTATAAKTISINAATESTVTATNFAAATTVNLSGAGKLTLDVAGAGALKTIAAGSATGAQVLTIAATATSVTTGSGKDTITQGAGLGATQSINSGAGDDTISVTTLTAGGKINGGDGTDTLKAALAAALTTVDYDTLKEVVSNVETLSLTTVTTAADGDNLAQFKTLAFAGNGANTVTDVAAAQTIQLAGGSVTATTKGFTEPTAPATAIAGAALTALATKTGTLTANASTLTATVAPAEDDNAVALTIAAGSKVNSATVTLNSSVDKTDGVATADNIASLVYSPTYANLTSLTVKGNGKATVSNAGGELATIDASGLTGLSYNGDILANGTMGFTYTGNATVAETIRLGAGADKVTVASTYAKMDTINGFDAVKETNTAKSTTDSLAFGGIAAISGAAAGEVVKVATVTANDSLLSALQKAAVASNADANNTDGAVVFFNLGGNTYLYQDLKSGTTADVLDDADLVVKIVGTVDFADDWGVFAA